MLVRVFMMLCKSRNQIPVKMLHILVKIRLQALLITCVVVEGAAQTLVLICLRQQADRIPHQHWDRGVICPT
jgi:hypothetical protein